MLQVENSSQLKQKAKIHAMTLSTEYLMVMWKLISDMKMWELSTGCELNLQLQISGMRMSRIVN